MIDNTDFFHSKYNSNNPVFPDDYYIYDEFEVLPLKETQLYDLLCLPEPPKINGRVTIRFYEKGSVVCEKTKNYKDVSEFDFHKKYSIGALLQEKISK